MHTILDLDLDVFSSPTVYWPRKHYRHSDHDYVCASAGDCRCFLERQCGLSRDTPIPGHEFTDHDEAFYIWRHWIRQGSLTPPFAIVHVDAHADMGVGDLGYWYLLSELLALPVEQRGNPRRGLDALTAGNFLMFAVANRWVDRLTYHLPIRQPWEANWNSSAGNHSVPVPPADALPEDLMVLHFRNGDWKTGVLELRHCSNETLQQWLNRGEPLEPVIHVEPPVPFDFIRVPNFRFSGFTHMVVARSPQYAPPAAAGLLPIIREYFVSC